MLNMSISEFREYQRGLRTLIEALEGNHGYRQAMETVKRLSSGGKSPYTLDIVEVPAPVAGFWQD